MDYNHIAKLLERYFEGESTLAEERELRRYFNEETVAPEHLPYRSLFRFFAHSQEKNYAGKVMPKAASATGNQVAVRRLRIRPVFWRAAAAVAITLGAWLLYPTTEPQPTAIDWSQYEPATPEEAFQLTSRALKNASSRLNAGAKQAAQEVIKVKKVF